MALSQRIFVAGHTGMAGSAILRQLTTRGIEPIVRPKSELDLVDQAAVRRFMKQERPDAIILAAAKVGGIHANNTYPAEFISDNLAIELNVIREAFAADVHQLLFLGSSCIYPKYAEQPIREEALLSGALEPTNEPYAIAKIAGIKLCEAYNRQYGTDFRSIMPTNLYGPGDNFHLENAHVLPALLRRFHRAARGGESVEIWGTGKPRREFLHVDDMAAASLFVMDLDLAAYRAGTGPELNHLNVGSGSDVTIRELAALIAKVTGFEGEVRCDISRPDGAPRKLLDVTRLASMGWRAKIPLEEGIEQTYAWFSANQGTHSRI